jgi:hypothetical protein
VALIENDLFGCYMHLVHFFSYHFPPHFSITTTSVSNGKCNYTKDEEALQSPTKFLEFDDLVVGNLLHIPVEVSRMHPYGNQSSLLLILMSNQPNGKL